MQKLLFFLFFALVACLPLAEAQDNGGIMNLFLGSSPGGAPLFFTRSDALVIRPHFSEAVAFANGRQTATTIDVVGQKIDFDYQGSFRTSVGMFLGAGDESISMTYTLLDGENATNGSVAGPGQFIVDPFGNVVGAVTIVDPTDARFGTTVTGGDLIRTQTSVNLNVYDIEYSRSWVGGGGALQLDAGVRIADVDETYRSDISLGGFPIAAGTFAQQFVGAGPRVGLRGQRWLGADGWISINTGVHGSWLVGDHHVLFTNSVALPFAASQRNDQGRTVPVLEAEVSTDMAITQNLTVSTGWMFQSWYDLGASGGTFGGLFAGSDDGNVMSFDGFFARINFYR